MELQWTVVSCSDLCHAVHSQWCPPSDLSSACSTKITGPVLQLGWKNGASTHSRNRSLIAHSGRELSTWRTSITGGHIGMVEFQQRRPCPGRKLQWKEKVVANAVKDEEVEVNSAVEKGGGSSSSFLTFLCPLLKLIGGGDPAAPRNAFLESATSGIASLARLPWGSQVDAGIAERRERQGQPPQLFQLYEFEACPFCRRVREALTELDLSAEVYPCPKGSLRHREFVLKTGGKEQFCFYPCFSLLSGTGNSLADIQHLHQRMDAVPNVEGQPNDNCLVAYNTTRTVFPYFHDPNTGVSLYESSEIVNYLFKEYGGDRKPTTGLLESTLVTGWVPTIMRAGRGMMLYSKATSNPPPSKLELYSYENNQFARLVREALCELELPYILRNAGKGSSSRDSLLKLAGSTQVPYLVDPNTGKSMAESLNIIGYLFETYGAST